VALGRIDGFRIPADGSPGINCLSSADKKAPEREPAGVHSRAIDAFYFNLVDAMRRGRFPTDVAARRLSCEGHSPCEPEWQALHVDESLLSAAN
jgi:hypothetical protein